MSNICLVIGNGFDLDLGLKSSYKDYFESDEFKEISNDLDYSKYEYSLIGTLKTKYEIERWIDLEAELANFTDSYYSQYGEFEDNTTKIITEFNQNELIKIHSSLFKYLKRVTSDQSVNIDSVAYNLITSLQARKRGSLSIEVITYNYTSIPDIKPDIPVTYVHGSINDQDIIIGISDNHKVDKGHGPFIKSHNQYYKSSNVRSRLKAAEIVIFFGHSLGQSDYHYFQEFFKDQSNVDVAKGMKNKFIYIFTYDEKSRQQIIWDLRVMNDGDVNLLFDHNKFRVIKVSELKEKHKFLDSMIKDINNLIVKSQRKTGSPFDI